jgi:hypothetical protein
MWRLAFIVSLGVLIALAVARPFIGEAQARVGACGPFELLVEALGKSYGEVPSGRGVLDNYVTVLMLSPERSFTILTKNARGGACIVAEGSDWEFAATKPVEEKL